MLVRNLFMSVDPGLRGRMNDGKSCAPPFEVGKPLDGDGVGEGIESHAQEFKRGDAVILLATTIPVFLEARLYPRRAS